MPRWLLITAIVGTGLNMASLPVAAYVLLLSPMMFDAGDTPAAWEMFLTALAWPASSILGSTIAWTIIQFRRSAWGLIPLVPALGFDIAFVIFMRG